MPELPEVETLRRDIESCVVGRVVERVVVTGARTVRRQSVAQFADALGGRRVVRARRHGKYLLADLHDGAALVVHLRMSGQLRLLGAEAGAGLVPHTHAVLGLDDGAELRFVDPRTFGELFVTSELDSRGRPVALAALGPDPLTDGVDAGELRRLLARRRTSLKAFLLDQSVLAGVGNLYADEICFAARLRPDRRTESVDDLEAGRLTGAVPAVLAEAVRLRGSTLRDAGYCDLHGRQGLYQDRHAVYGRVGEPCPSCGSPIVRTTVAGRSAHLCTRCQS